jgi:hypothetical protein
VLIKVGKHYKENGEIPNSTTSNTGMYYKEIREKHQLRSATIDERLGHKFEFAWFVDECPIDLETEDTTWDI